MKRRPPLNQRTADELEQRREYRIESVEAIICLLLLALIITIALYKAFEPIPPTTKGLVSAQEMEYR